MSGNRVFYVGYNLVWRIIFFVFAACMLAASIALLVQSVLGVSEGLLLPSSVLLAAILMSVYLIPFISTRQQMLAVGPDGLEFLNAERNRVLARCTSTRKYSGLTPIA